MKDYFEKIEESDIKVDFSEVKTVIDDLVEKQMNNATPKPSVTEPCISPPIPEGATVESYPREWIAQKVNEANRALYKISLELGKNVVEIAQTKAFIKNIYYRRLNVAAADKTNTNDKAREAACAVALDSDPLYQQYNATMTTLEGKNEVLKADVIYSKVEVLMYLGLLGIENPGTVFGSFSEIK